VRRIIVWFLPISLALVLIIDRTALAESWPQKPVTLIVPFPAGGGTDAFARPLAQQLDQQLGVRVLIDNRAGAGGNVGATSAAKAAPDGYTFFVGATHHAIAHTVYAKLGYDLEADFVPIGMISHVPHIVVAGPGKVSAKTFSELVTYVRANPGTVSYASGGAGTVQHLAGELFKVLTKTRIQHVPYRGSGPMGQDLIAGHVDMAFDGLGTSAAQVREGRLRGLAITAPKRVATLPEIPTAEEAGLPGFEVSTWYGLWAPKHTPEAVVDRMTAELQTALRATTIRQAWENNGSEIPSFAGVQFGTFVSAEIVRWGKVVKEAGVKVE
jgi:tripartite-type tricarboxylate transporter receptor subunit TctC